GSMQGHVGQASMPRIKGLELDTGHLDDIVDVVEASTTRQNRSLEMEAPEPKTSHAGANRQTVREQQDSDIADGEPMQPSLL
ncbi:MAG TPA: hypothetical protein VK978_03260, partial [Candidatus Saccharimonadales bacterium]|nr:hypothetical protein [Candidatus Saccharimonadales bacterium]